MKVVVEGINGSGKSTVVAEVMRQLRFSGAQVETLDPASSTPWSQKLRRTLVAPDWPENLSPTAAAFGFAACRVDGLRRIQTTPKGIIVLERWAGAVASYGAATGAAPNALRHLITAMNALFMPDVTILIDVPIEVAASRLSGLGSSNWYETAGLAQLAAIRQAYLCWATDAGVLIVDGDREVQTVAADLLSAIKAKRE